LGANEENGMNRKDKIIRMLIATAGVIFGVSALIKEWKLSLVVIVPLLIAMVYGIVGKTPDTSEKRLEELFNKDEATKR
jgi:hypothetical protein